MSDTFKRMPRSKRNKVVSLTKVSGKGRDLKTTLVETLRASLDGYENLFHLKFENLRSSRMRHVRMDWRESRIFLGKNSVAKIALGRTEEEEYMDNLHLISQKLVGQSGLLFTNRSKKEVLKYFKALEFPEFPKAGFVPEENIVVKVGVLDFTVSMVDQLRKLGLIVEVKDGKLELREQYIAAKKGVALTPEQATMLKHLNRPLTHFKVGVESYWRKDGKIEEF